MLGLDDDSSIWVCIYFPVSWLTQFGHGLVTTVVGPTQPYLAEYARQFKDFYSNIKVVSCMLVYAKNLVNI